MGLKNNFENFKEVCRHLDKQIKSKNQHFGVTVINGELELYFTRFGFGDYAMFKKIVSKNGKIDLKEFNQFAAEVKKTYPTTDHIQLLPFGNDEFTIFLNNRGYLNG